MLFKLREGMTVTTESLQQIGIWPRFLFLYRKRTTNKQTNPNQNKPKKTVQSLYLEEECLYHRKNFSNRENVIQTSIFEPSHKPEWPLN